MNEFLKLNWRVKDLKEINQQLCFLPENVVSDSYVYKHFTKPLKSRRKPYVKLSTTKEKYVPGKSYFQPIQKRSLLTKLQKSHCLTALKLIQSGKNPDLMSVNEKYSLKIYTTCQQKLVEESKNFLQFVHTNWESNKNRPLKIKPGIFNYSKDHWVKKIQRYRDYPQFYRELSQISLTYDENESTVNFIQTSNLLEMGSLARFSPPNLQDLCKLKICTLPTLEQKSLNSKLPVSRDENVAKLLEKNQFDVVISSSGLKQLIDFPNTKNKWILPVIIKEISVDQTKKKVIFIDKVLAKLNPSYYDLKYYSYKQLLKSNFCQYKAFSFPVEEVPSESIEVTEENDVTENEQEKPKKGRSIHHNISYRIWNIKKTDTHNTLVKNKVKDTEINLLVRCKLDACECIDQGILLPVVIRPKIEQQLKFGANISSKSELARDWTSLFFRIYSNLYRIRISELSDVISVEKCTAQKINSEALTQYDYKPILGIGVLQKILQELMSLECGNYLLQHLPKHESFLSIMKQCNQPESTYDLHSELENFKIDRESRPNWLPIDVNYILPVHEEYQQPPATFKGFDNHSRAKKKKKKGAKNKKKTTTGKSQGEKDESLI